MSLLDAAELEWEPDEQMIDAARCGRLDAKTMSHEDRCFVVARLTMLGETADVIADRLHCSSRLVKRIRAEALTVMIVRAEKAETRVRALESTRARVGHLTAVRDSELAAENARLRKQVDQLVTTVGRLRAHLRDAQAQRPLIVRFYRKKSLGRRQAEAVMDPLFPEIPTN